MLATTNMRTRPHPAVPLVVTGAVAAGAFVALARRVAHHHTDALDLRAREQLRRHGGPRIRRVARATEPAGKWYVHGPLAAALAAYTKPRSRAAALAIALSSGGSAAVSRVLERAAPPATPPPPGNPNQCKPGFPSNHALEAAAVGLTTAYVLARERRAVAGYAAPAAALVPFLSGVGKAVLDRHWASDVVGGWLAGAAVAAGCAAVYELTPD